MSAIIGTFTKCPPCLLNAIGVVMPDYLHTAFDLADENLASACDEVPFWSFPFGNLMLSNIRLHHDTTALDIGFGTGYPLLELSQRLEENINEHARYKGEFAVTIPILCIEATK
jgi:hypothetical protein